MTRDAEEARSGLGPRSCAWSARGGGLVLAAMLCCSVMANQSGEEWWEVGDDGVGH